MINLAGNVNADRCIEEELFLAGITPYERKIASIDEHRWATYEDGGRSEVPYSIIGKLEGWTFKRLWYYYSASCLDYLGLPYDTAVELHERPYPIQSKKYGILGKAVRVDGDCTYPHPRDCNYPSQKSIEKRFVEARKEFPETDFNSEESWKSSPLRELDGIGYIRLYHVDTIVGLKALADTIRKEVEE